MQVTGVMTGVVSGVVTCVVSGAVADAERMHVVCLQVRLGLGERVKAACLAGFARGCCG